MLEREEKLPETSPDLIANGSRDVYAIFRAYLALSV
jgi:hypothetical protein